MISVRFLFPTSNPRNVSQPATSVITLRWVLYVHTRGLFGIISGFQSVFHTVLSIFFMFLMHFYTKDVPFLRCLRFTWLSLFRSSTISRSSLGVVMASNQDQQWLDVTTIKVTKILFLEIFREKTKESCRLQRHGCLETIFSSYLPLR